LDPAGPGFEPIPLITNHLEPSDALFVDVIHTNPGILGYVQPTGTVDFYPNGINPNQPGCSENYGLLDSSKLKRGSSTFICEP